MEAVLAHKYFYLSEGTSGMSFWEGLISDNIDPFGIHLAHSSTTKIQAARGDIRPGCWQEGAWPAISQLLENWKIPLPKALALSLKPSERKFGIQEKKLLIGAIKKSNETRHFGVPAWIGASSTQTRRISVSSSGAFQRIHRTNLAEVPPDAVDTILMR